MRLYDQFQQMNDRERENLTQQQLNEIGQEDRVYDSQLDSGEDPEDSYLPAAQQQRIQRQQIEQQHNEQQQIGEQLQNIQLGDGIDRLVRRVKSQMSSLLEFEEQDINLADESIRNTYAEFKLDSDLLIFLYGREILEADKRHAEISASPSSSWQATILRNHLDVLQGPIPLIDSCFPGVDVLTYNWNNLFDFDSQLSETKATMKEAAAAVAAHGEKDEAGRSESANDMTALFEKLDALLIGLMELILNEFPESIPEEYRDVLDREWYENLEDSLFALTVVREDLQEKIEACNLDVKNGAKRRAFIASGTGQKPRSPLAVLRFEYNEHLKATTNHTLGEDDEEGWDTVYFF